MQTIEIKDKFVERRLLTHAYHPLLIALYYSFDDIMPEFRKIITSAYRPSKGVHGTNPGRGLDLRCHSHWVGRYLAREVSGYWSYDIVRPHKKCVIYHTSKDENGNDIKNGMHLHLQVHPNTKFIGESKNGI